MFPHGTITTGANATVDPSHIVAKIARAFEFYYVMASKPDLPLRSTEAFGLPLLALGRLVMGTPHAENFTCIIRDMHQ